MQSKTDEVIEKAMQARRCGVAAEDKGDDSNAHIVLAS